MTALPIVMALALSASGPLSLYVKDGSRLRLEIDVDPISNRHGIAVAALAAQAEEALAACGFRVDPGASGTVAVTVRGNDGGEGFSATVVVRARHQSVVNGSVLSVYIYDDEATVAGPKGEEAARVKAHLSSQFQVLCGTKPRASTEKRPGAAAPPGASPASLYSN